MNVNRATSIGYAGSTDRISFVLVTFGGTTLRLLASNFRESTDFVRQTSFALTQFRSVISCLLFYLCIVRKCSFVCTGNAKWCAQLASSVVVGPK
jgi:hypothetical protein